MKPTNEERKVWEQGRGQKVQPEAGLQPRRERREEQRGVRVKQRELEQEEQAMACVPRASQQGLASRPRVQQEPLARGRAQRSREHRLLVAHSRRVQQGRFRAQVQVREEG